jgi:SAM-dependent methyltransferase
MCSVRRMRDSGQSLGSSQPGSVHRSPRVPVVDRVRLLLDLARDKSVIDLGFVDAGRMTVKRKEGMWLHADLQRVTRQLVGIDADASGVELARDLGYTAYVGDCQSRESLSDLGLEPAEVVVAGELIEHLDRSGDFLEAIKELITPDGILIVTTPNCLSLTNFLAALAARELVNPDHVAWLSPRTLRTLLTRHGWDVRAVYFYRFPSVGDSTTSGRISRVQAALFTGFQLLARPIFRACPWLADGLVFVVSLTDASVEAA